MPKENLFWYSSGVQGIQIGEKEKTKGGHTGHYSFGDYTYPSIYDTGTSLIFPPKKIARDVVSRIVSGYTHQLEYESGLMFVDCQDRMDFPKVKLLIDNVWFELLPQDYIVEYNYEGDTFCFLAIATANSGNYWLLGDAFLLGYYSIHDNDDHSAAKIGFAPHATSSKSKPTPGSPPETDFSEVSWEFHWTYSMYLFFKPIMLIKNPWLFKLMYNIINPIQTYFWNLFIQILIEIFLGSSQG